MEIGFTYNADGIRTSKTVHGAVFEYMLNGSQPMGVKAPHYTMLYLYDESGSPILEQEQYMALTTAGGLTVQVRIVSR